MELGGFNAGDAPSVEILDVVLWTFLEAMIRAEPKRAKALVKEWRRITTARSEAPKVVALAPADRLSVEERMERKANSIIARRLRLIAERMES